MKTLKSGGHKLLATLIAASFLSPMAFGQDDLLIATDQVLESEQIDVDGLYTERRQSQGDRLAKLRKNLEKQNEDMVQKKIEDMRMAEERKLAKKLRKAFNGGSLSSLNTVETGTTKTVSTSDKTNKLIPSFGLLNIVDEDFESKLSVGLTFESMVTDNISVGFTANYSKVELEDMASSQNGVQGYFYNPFLSTEFDGREMSYTRADFEVNGKYFLTTTKFKPYIGLGLGYTRSSLRYTESANNGLIIANNSDEDEKHTDGFITGSVTAGGEFLFSDTIGLNFGVKYQTAFNAGQSDDNDDEISNNLYSDVEERRLESQGSILDESDVFTLGVGLVVRF